MLAQLLLCIAGVLLVGFLTSLAWVAFMIATSGVEMPIHRHNDDFGGDYEYDED